MNIFTLLLIVMALISALAPVKPKILGYVAYQAAGYSSGLMNLHIILTAIAFILALITAEITTRASERFLHGYFKEYIRWNSYGKILLVLFIVSFFLVEMIVFYFQSYAPLVQVFDTFGLIALILSFVFFIKASQSLHHMSKTYGFAKQK